VLDTSKLVAGQGPQQRSRVESQPVDDAAQRFQEMVATRSDREGAAPRPAERPEASPDRGEDVVDLTPETLVSVVAPPAREDESEVLGDEPSPPRTEPEAPAQPQPAPAPAPAQASAAATAPAPAPTPAWKPLTASALDAARGHDPAPALRDKPVPPPPVLAAPAEPSPEPQAGGGVRAWLASKGAPPAAEVTTPTVDAAATASADAPAAGPGGSLPVGLAGAPAVKWAEVMRKGAQRAQGSPVAGAPAVTAGSSGSGDLPRELMDLIAGKSQRPETAPEEAQPDPPAAADRPANAPREDSLLQAFDKAMAAAREPATPAGAATRSAAAARPAAPPQPAFFAPAPEQPPGAMRIRVPTANGETVRGSLHVDPDTRAVRLTLAVQEGDTARSMSTAHEMLRARLADEGYQLNSYVVRHDGKSIVRLDSGQLDPGGASADGGAEGDPAGDPNSQRPDADNPREPLEPPEVPELTDDPVIAGWFV